MSNQTNKIVPTKSALSDDERLTNHLKQLMEDRVEITPYRIVQAKIKLGLTPSGKELSELETYITDELLIED